MTTPPSYLGDASILELIKNGTLRRSHLNAELQSRFAAAFNMQEAERITGTEEADA